MSRVLQLPRRVVPTILILGLFVATVAAVLAVRSAPAIHAVAASNSSAPFEAHFQEQIVAVDHQPCPGLTGIPLCITVEGIGTANYLGNATEALRGGVDFSNPDPNCLTLTTAPPGVTISADDGSGTLTIQHDFAESCALANSHGVSKLSITWTISGGTGRFCGATGSGTETGTDNGPTGKKEVHYAGTISLPDNPSAC